MKRILSICLCLLLLLSVAAPACAENQSRTVIGADLSPEQVEAVYQSFGLRRGDVVELTMTNAEERRYLEGLVDERVIGSRSISCVYVELLPEGSGLSIATNNVTWWTEEMYISALTTAGIKDARIIVSAPFEVSGTSALSGIYKAYEDMTGLSLDELAKQVSTEELTITGDLAQQIGNMDSTSIVSELKLVLNETKNMSDDEIRAIITEIAGRYKRVDDGGHVHLLSGIVKCPICGKGLTGMISRTKNLKGDGYYKPIYYYKCRYNTRQNGKTCPFDQSLNQEIIDGLVMKILQKLQTYREFQDALQAALGDQGNLEKTEKRLQDLRKELREAELTKDRFGEKLDGLNPLGKDYDRKYEETSDKLDSIYDRIGDLEMDVISTKKKLEALKQKADSTVQIMTFMENLPLMYEEMSEEERKEMFQAFVDEIELFPEDRTDGKIIKSISFKFPMVFDGKPLAKNTKPEDMVSFRLDCTDIDIELPGKGNIIMKKQADGSQKVIVRKGTYAAIKAYILEKHDVKVPTLYIAQIKRKYGLEIGKAYNKPEKNKNHVPKCTKEKELLIMEALKFYDLMEQDVEYREDAV